jgi:ADP-ribose pyrophosphatase YjhB (NUDIX family)
LDIKSLINPQEIEELARQYGPIERRSFSLGVGKKNFEYWREELTQKRRGEVVLVVHRPAGVILHTKDFYPPGTFRLPSGGVKWGEGVLHALHREAREEMGLEVEVERFLGLLEHELHCEEETLLFVSYVFLVKGSKEELAPQDEEEHILSFRQVPLEELPAVAGGLRALEEDWQDWGEFRAIAHDFVVEMMRGRYLNDSVTPEIR